MSPCPGIGSTEPSGGRPAGQDPYLSAQLSSLDYSTSGEAKGGSKGPLLHEATAS